MEIWFRFPKFVHRLLRRVGRLSSASRRVARRVAPALDARHGRRRGPDAHDAVHADVRRDGRHYGFREAEGHGQDRAAVRARARRRHRADRLRRRLSVPPRLAPPLAAPQRRAPMSTYVGAIDQGTTSSRFIVFDRQGAIVAVAQREHRADLSEARLGRARRGGDLAQHRGRDRRGAGARRRRGLRARGRRHHQSARDDGVWDRNTGAPLHNALVWQDTRIDRARRGVRARRRPGPLPRARTGLPLATYFSGLKLTLAARQRAGRARAAQRRRRAVRHDRQVALWNLTGGPAGGVHLTDVTNASRTQLVDLATLGLGRRAARRVPDRRASLLPRIAPSSASYGAAKIARAARRADLGHPGRPAGGARRADLLRAGRGEEHLRHRLLHADEHGRAARAVDGGPASRPSRTSSATSRRTTRSKARSRSRARSCSGCATTWADRGRAPRSKRSRAEVQDNGDVYFVPGVLGPVRAVLARRRARRHRRALTRYANRGHIARARSKRVAYQTRDVARGDGEGLRHPDQASCASTAAWSRTSS